jgi:hypothetical protein
MSEHMNSEDMSMDTNTRTSHRRRRLAAVAAGLAVAAVLAASAATLGGLSADRVGGDSTIVLDSANGLNISWSDLVFDADTGAYTVNGLTLTSADPEVSLPSTDDGAKVKVALFDGNGNVVVESSSATGGGASYSVTFPTNVDIAQIARAVAYVSE